jgi:hypothetical protein
MSDWVVCWSGTLHRQDEQAYSLLGEGWIVRSNALLDAAPAKYKAEPSPRPRRVTVCGCGKEIRGSGHKQCWECRRVKLAEAPVPFAACACGRTIRSRGHTKCAKCREKAHRIYRGRYKVKVEAA